MDRSSSVSLEEKMDELELRKLGTQQQRYAAGSVANLTNLPSQFVGFGLLPDQARFQLSKRGYDDSL